MPTSDELMTYFAEEDRPFNLEERLQNPWVKLGASIMSASDPQRRGLGGIGQGILDYNRGLMDRSRFNAERELNMLKLRTARNALDRESALADLMSSPDFTGMGQQQLAQRLAQIDPVRYAQSMLDTMDPVETSNAMRIYQESGGQAGTGMSFNDWYQSQYKSGAAQVNVNTGNLGFEPAPPPPNYVYRPPTPEEAAAGDVGSYEPIPGGPEKPVSGSTQRDISIAQENVQQGEKLLSLLRNPDGTVDRGALAQMKLNPFSEERRELNAFAQNRGYLKSGAQVGTEELAQIVSALTPTIGQMWAGDESAIQAIVDALEYARGRSIQMKEGQEQPGGTPDTSGGQSFSTPLGSTITITK